MSEIIIPEGFGRPAGPKPKATRIRVVETDRVVSDAKQALRINKSEGVYIPLQFGVIEAPEGYIVVDEEGGHHKLPFYKDERITLLVWSRATSQPLAETDVTVGDLLRYTNKQMAVAEFVSNRDGMEERWEKLLVTLQSAGIIDVSADRERRARVYAEDRIVGGATSFDKRKKKEVEPED